MAWITSVTNRVVADDWFLSLNRVENNIEYLATEMAEYNYPTTELITITDWVRSDLFNYAQDDSARIIGNINTIIGLLADTGIDMPSDLDYLTFENANNIEKTLDWLRGIVDNLDEILIRLSFRLGGDKFGS